MHQSLYGSEKYLFSDRCHTAQYLCFRGLQRICSVGKVRNEFKQLQGGSVDFKKDEETGIATMLINNPGKGNAFSGSNLGIEEQFDLSQ